MGGNCNALPSIEEGDKDLDLFSETGGTISTECSLIISMLLLLFGFVDLLLSIISSVSLSVSFAEIRGLERLDNLSESEWTVDEGPNEALS
jgi:hypothetical protein